jgi:hypothetical protein
MNDIDLNLGIGGAGWTPIGTEADPFTGVFDGNNKTISGLWIYRPLEDNVGLFGCIAGTSYGEFARIENLHIKIISGGKVHGRENIGGLTGKNVGARISGCSVKGEVVGYRSVSLLVGDNSTDYSTWNNAYIIGSEVEGGVTGEQNVGGLAGYNAGNIEDGSHANVKLNGVTWVGGLVGFNYGNIFKSYALGSVTSKNEADQGEYIGGLVGSNGGTVMNCHSSVAVIGDKYTGGLVGYNFDKDYSLIENCYSVGEVSGSPTWSGGFVGKNDGKVHGCVYDSTTAKTSKGIGYISETGAADNEVLPCSTAVMYQQATYAGWDFTDVWSISEGNYPYLTGYETAPPTPPTPEPEPEPDPPPFIEITTPPSPASYSYGGTATLSVVARLSSGRGVLRYQWYRSQEAGVLGTPIEGAIFSGYSLPRLSAGTYYYCCVVSSTVATSVPSNAARIDVRQVDLHISVANASRVYNTPNPDFPLAYSGFISGENAHSLDSLPRASCAATSLSPVDTYDITVSGGGSSNYNLIYGTGTLTVEKASVSISDFLVDTIARPITVVHKAGTGLTVSQIYHNNIDTVPTAPGTYRITIDVSGGTNYKDTTGLYVGTYTISVPSPVTPVITITSQPTGGSRVYGSSTPTPRLRVDAELSAGAGDLRYRWYTAAGVAIPDSTANTYTPSVANAGTYCYYCIVSVAGGEPVTSTPGCVEIRPASLVGSNFLIDSTVSPIRVIPTKETIGVGAVTIYYNGKSPTDIPGTYLITVDVTSGINYAAVTGLYVGTYTVHTPPSDPSPVDPVPVDPSDPSKPVDPSDPVAPDDSSISVWLPSVSGLSTLPVSGRYPLTLGATFTFTVSLPSPSSSVSVSTSRSPSTDASRLVLLPSPQSLTVHILDVRESLTVSLRLDPPSSTGTFPPSPSPSSPLVWATPGYLHTESITPQIVKIYNTNGQLVSMFPLLGTINTALPKGLYIVSTGNQQHKVFVR